MESPLGNGMDVPPSPLATQKIEIRNTLSRDYEKVGVNDETHNNDENEQELGQEQPLTGLLTGEVTVASIEEWNQCMNRMQRISCFAAHLLAVVAMVLVLVWINNTLGGLHVPWKKGEASQVFNWHPLLMMVAFCFMTVASLSFRFPLYQKNNDNVLYSNRTMIKFLHAIAWMVAAMCGLVAMIAVFQSHNDSKSGYIANLYSLHSWIGIAVIFLYILQFLVGAISFLPIPLFTQNCSLSAFSKAKILSIHTFVGPIIYILTMMTIFLGILEKEGFTGGCSYKVTKPDLQPIKNNFLIPASCLVGHSLGIVVLTMGLCTIFSLHHFSSRK